MIRATAIVRTKSMGSIATASSGELAAEGQHGGRTDHRDVIKAPADLASVAVAQRASE
jgi:hypothetical protein